MARSPPMEGFEGVYQFSSVSTGLQGCIHVFIRRSCQLHTSQHNLDLCVPPKWRRPGQSALQNMLPLGRPVLSRVGQYPDP